MVNVVRSVQSIGRNPLLGTVNIVGPARISKAEALNLAAWLVSLADPVGDEFPKWLEAVQSS